MTRETHSKRRPVFFPPQFFSCFANPAAAVILSKAVGQEEQASAQVQKRVFLRHLYTFKRSFHQDRLGTNIGKAQKKTRFPAQAAYQLVQKLRCLSNDTHSHSTTRLLRLQRAAGRVAECVCRNLAVTKAVACVLSVPVACVHHCLSGMWSNKAYLLRGTLNHKNGFETRRSSNFRSFSFGSSRFNVQMSAPNGATTQFESDRQSY
jgi:hypothetical protein